MGLSTFLFVLLSFIANLYLWMKHTYSYWRTRNVPFIEPSSVFGNVREVILMKINPAIHISNLYNHKNAQGQPLVGIYIFHKPALLLRDPELIKKVLIKNFNSFCSRYATCDPHGDPLGYLSIFIIKNPQWRELRTKLSPVFSSGKLKQMFSLIAEIGNELDDYLCKDPLDSIKEVKMLSSAFTIDVIASVALGLRTNTIQNPNSGLRQERMFTWTARKCFDIATIFFLPRLTGLFGCKVFSKETANFIRDTINQTIVQRIKTKTCRNDLIDALISIKHKAESEGEELNSDLIAAQAAVFFIAGFETTSSTIAFALHELSKAPEYQKRLRKEIKNTLSKNGGKITYEMLPEMEYLNMIVFETMRMYPTLPFLDRECVLSKDEEDFLLDKDNNVRIPHGMPIYISPFALHMDPKYFPSPEKFDPERFSNENKANITPFTYLPFGAGPRNCIGERLGIIKVKIGIISFLRNFYVTLDESHKNLAFNPKGLLLEAKGGLHCKFIRDPLFDKK